MARWMKYALWLAVLLLLASLPLAMQFETGGIQGTVTDEFGAIAGAKVEARRSTTGTIARATSDRAGFYKIEELRAGRYSLWVAALGHDSHWIREINVERGKTIREDVFISRARPTPTE